MKEEISRKKINKIKLKVKKLKRKLQIIKNNCSQRSENPIAKIEKYALKGPKRAIKKFIQSDKRISYLIRVLLSKRIAIIFLMVILIIKTEFFYKNIELEREEHTNFISFIFILVSILPLFLIKKDKNRFRGLIIYDLIFSTLLLADNIYWNYSSNLLSFSQIFYVKYAKEITTTLPYLMKAGYIWYIIDIPLLFALWKITRKSINKKKTKYIKNI